MSMNFIKGRSAWFTGASLLALGLTVAPASAQDAESTSTDEARRLSTVTVTATQRAEDIQDVPIAVTALSQEALEDAGAVDLTSIASLSPTVNFTNAQSNSGTTSIRIRGVGTLGNNIGLESSVGTFIDGVYQPRPGMALSEFVDVKQIEILRGPQGTLFGRNTSAGALVLQSNAPVLGETGGNVEASLGSENLFNVKGAVNLPAADNLAFRLAGSYRSRDGLYGSTQGLADGHDIDRFFVRGQAYWEPSEAVNLRLIADYSDSEENCCFTLINQETLILPFFELAGLPAGAGVTDFGDAAVDDRLHNFGDGRPEAVEHFGVSAELNVDLGGAKLTVIPAFRDFSSSAFGDGDGTSLDVLSTPANTPVNIDIKSTTLEARLQGDALDGRLDWMVGGFYGDEEISELNTLTLGPDADAYLNATYFSVSAGATMDPFLLFGANPVGLFSQGGTLNGASNSNMNTQDSETFSIFTHNIFDVTEDLSLSVGVRYVDESKNGGAMTVAGGNPACLGALTNPLFAPGGGLEPFAPLGIGLLCVGFYSPELTVPFNTDFEDDALTYVVSGRYEFSPNVSAYASVSRGFKSGGLNLDLTAGGGGPGGQTFESEEVDSIELGLKTTLFDGRVRANVALFDQSIENFQLNTFDGVAFQVFNVPKANSQGVELEFQGDVADWLGVNAGVTFTDASYPSDCAGSITDATVLALCGTSLPNAPEFSAVIGLNANFNISENMQLRFLPSLRHDSEYFTSPTDTSFVQEDTTLVDLRASIGAVDGNWSLEVWGKNVTDEAVALRGQFPIFLRGAGPAAATGSLYNDPATYGVTLRKKF